MVKIKFIFALSSLIVLCALPIKSFANIENAVQCYEDQKYSCAFDNFKNEFDLGNYYDGIVPYYLGELYYKGNGAEKDINLGAALMTLAYTTTSYGDIKFMSSTNLAWGYANTIGIRDKEKAAYWANLSLNDAEALTFNNYGVFLHEGYIFEQDLFKAYEYYKKATLADEDQQIFYPYSNLGKFYTLGLGPLRQNKEKAISHFQKAIELGGNRASSAETYLRVIERYERLPEDKQEFSLWLEEDILDYGNSNFLVIGWLHDGEDIVEGMKWFILQSRLGEDINDRDRALELIDRGKEIINYDKNTLSKINIDVQSWIDANWK